MSLYDICIWVFVQVIALHLLVDVAGRNIVNILNQFNEVIKQNEVLDWWVSALYKPCPDTHVCLSVSALSLLLLSYVSMLLQGKIQTWKT